MPWFKDSPIKFQREDTRRALELLVQAYSDWARAKALAQDAAVDVLEVPASGPEVTIRVQWRSLLEVASRQDRLEALLRRVLADPRTGGCHSELRRISKLEERAPAGAGLGLTASLLAQLSGAFSAAFTDIAIFDDLARTFGENPNTFYGPLDARLQVLIDRADREGIQAVTRLVRAAVRISGAHAQLVELERASFPSVVPADLRVALAKALETVRSSALHDAFRRSVPQGAALTAKGPGQVVDALAGFGSAGDRTVPCLELAARLVTEQPALREWLDAARHRVHEPRSLEALLASVAALQAREGAAEDPSPPHVLVVLKKGAKDVDYTLQAWIMNSKGEDVAYVAAGEGPLATLPALFLDRLLRDAAVARRLEARRASTLFFEFVLPRELLCHPVETWPMPEDGETFELGSLYPVVVRSKDRAYGRPRDARWLERSDAVRNQPSAPIVWLKHARPDRVRVLRTTLVLRAAFIPSAAADAEAALEDCVKQGTPVALLSRTPGDERRPHFDALLALEGDLRTNVMSRRANDPHGRDLVLLWDHDERYPPDAPPT